MMRLRVPLLVPFVVLRGLVAQAPPPPDQRLDRLKAEVARAIDAQATFAQQMVDQVFSFGELGMQEIETSKYLSAILERNGFALERRVAGIPTAWVARWGSGKPVIALGSDIDCIPQASQKPGVASHDPIIEGAPGHGEGHNSGVPLNILAALAVKDIMTRERLPGTIVLWPGVAEEQLGSKAFLVRAGVFRDVDANLFAHVGDEYGISWGDEPALALISALFKFKGQSAHAAGAPWRGRSALDGVMTLANAWEYHREHMEPAQRSHYVITDGGDQPNVVPSTAAIWFYFRERDPERVTKMFEDAKQIARAAALATFTTVDTVQVIGSAWRPHFNKPIAEALHAIAMATPIAHKGVIAGAKVQAMTLLDLMLQPKLLSDAKDYFANVQTKATHYRPLMAPTDQPATWLNAEKMARYRDQMRKYYYDPAKYETYLKQLGISYPTVPMRAP